MPLSHFKTVYVATKTLTTLLTKPICGPGCVKAMLNAANTLHYSKVAFVDLSIDAAQIKNLK